MSPGRDLGTPGGSRIPSWCPSPGVRVGQTGLVGVEVAGDMQLYRQRMHREHSDASRADIDDLVRAWLVAPARSGWLIHQARPRRGTRMAGVNAGTNCGRLGSGPAAKVLAEELIGGRGELQPVLRLGEPVALVGEQHVVVVDARLLQGSDDLLRLGLLHPRVICPLSDEH